MTEALTASQALGAAEARSDAVAQEQDDRRRRLLRGAAQRLAPWAVPLGLLAFWEIAARFGWIDGRKLPPPSRIAEAFSGLVADGQMAAGVQASALRAFAGLAIGGSFGFLMGILNGLSRPADLLLNSSLQILRNVPHLAIIPFVMLWLGIGEASKIFLVAVGVFFPIYINTYHGVRTLDPGLLEMARVYGLGPWARFWRVVLPGALPSIFVGLRFSLGLMWLTLIVAELIAAQTGIGYITMTAREFMLYDVMLVGILLYGGLGVASDAFTRLLERKALAWHPNFAPQEDGSPR